MGAASNSRSCLWGPTEQNRAWSPPGCSPDPLPATRPATRPTTQPRHPTCHPTHHPTRLALQSFPWRLSRSNGLALPHKERQYTIASALPKPCFFEDFCGPYAKASMKGPYFLTEYSTHQLFTQLTLLQQVRRGAGPTAVCWRDTWTHSEGGRRPDAQATGSCHPKGDLGQAWALGPQWARTAGHPAAPVPLTPPPRRPWRVLCAPP